VDIENYVHIKVNYFDQGFKNNLDCGIQVFNFLDYNILIPCRWGFPAFTHSGHRCQIDQDQTV